MSLNGKLKGIPGLTGKIKFFGIDKTLTKDGMCAEAKVTGDEIRTLKERVNQIIPKYAENIYYDTTEEKSVKSVLDGMQSSIGVQDSKVEDANDDLDNLKRTVGYVTSKNLLKNNYKNRIVNDVTYTVNADKSITLNGIATNEMSFYINDSVVLEKGKYIFSGFPENFIGEASLKISLPDFDAYLGFGLGSIEFELHEQYECSVELIMKKGTVCENVTLYPMIRPVGTDDIYEPYVEDSVKTQINNITSDLRKVRKNEWELLNQGETTCDISNIPYYANMYVQVQMHDSGDHLEAIFVPLHRGLLSTSLTTMKMHYSAGAYKNANDNIYVKLEVDAYQRSIKLIDATVNGKDCLADANMYVWWNKINNRTSDIE